MQSGTTQQRAIPVNQPLFLHFAKAHSPKKKKAYSALILNHLSKMERFVLNDLQSPKTEVSVNISTEQTSTSISVIISGDMDAIGCNSMRAQFEALAVQHQCEAVILNLKEVAYLDSSGIGAIVFLFKRIQATGGKLGIIGVSGQPRELLKLLRIDKTISIQFGDQGRGAHHPSSLTSIIARNQPLGWSAPS